MRACEASFSVASMADKEALAAQRRPQNERSSSTRLARATTAIKIETAIRRTIKRTMRYAGKNLRVGTGRDGMGIGVIR